MSLPAGDPRHGTTNGYTNHGCRCPECRQAATDYLREYRHRTGRNVPREVYNAARRAEALARDNHGTESRYKRCRCDECKAAAAEKRRERRKHAHPAKHGSYVSYSNGCRCDACREAHNANQKALRAAKRVAA